MPFVVEHIESQRINALEFLAKKNNTGVMMFRILILTDELFPYLGAASKIAYSIAQELVNHFGCAVSMIGFNRSKVHSFPNPDFQLETLRIKSVTDCEKIFLTYDSKFLKLLMLMLHPKAFRYYIGCKIKGRDDMMVQAYQSEIRRALRNKKYDCIIGFMMPEYTLIAISDLNISIPILSYKLDPWSTNFRLNDNKEIIKQIEAKIDQKVKRIIVTDLIKKDYESFADDDIIKKLIPMEFPNVNKSADTERLTAFQKGKFHCVFAGGLYNDIRNPLYTIKLFNFLQKNNIVFHIVGSQYGKPSLPNPLPDNIIYHGQVSGDEAMRYMQSADILVNIGNTILNQMPSKILTYISLGKPILNIIKNPNCPTLPYMAKYPLALNVLETPTVQEEDVKRVRKFILENKGKQIPFEKIKEKYYTCTPEYVGGQLYDIICKVVEEHKEKEKK